MSIFGGTEKKQEHVLVLNIGSASVAGAFVLVGENKSTIVSTVSSDIAVMHDLTFEQFEKEMTKALSATLEALVRERKPRPDRIVVYLSSPWYASQVRTAKVSRPSPFVVSNGFVSDMISRELKAFEQEELAAHKGTAEALRAIESKTLRVKLNGYPNANPIGLSARELEFSLFISVTPEKMVTLVEGIIARHYHAPVSFSTFLFASFVVSRDFFPHQDEYLLVDIGGEITDVSLIQEGTLAQSVSFPRGRNFILRKLSAGLSRSTTEAATICKLYTEGKVEDSVKDACARILREAKDQWVESFQQALTGISAKLSIPDAILLSVGADIAPWFQDVLRRDELHHYTLTDKEFKVVLLDATLFHEALSFADGVPRNPFIMIEALSVSRK